MSFVEKREWIPFPVKVGVFCNFVLGVFLFCLHSAVRQVGNGPRITIGA